jgi:periplasmic mercuric ion binding protein
MQLPTHDNQGRKRRCGFPTRSSVDGGRWLARSITASSCCILPLVLFGLGVSGAWIGNFTQLAPIRCAGLWIGYARQVAFAGEKTVTLAVKNMYCADGPFIVKKSLEGVPGVAKAVVSLKDKTAIVTFDDTKADVSALTNATTKAGYPSTPES